MTTNKLKLGLFSDRTENRCVMTSATLKLAFRNFAEGLHATRMQHALQMPFISMS